MDKEQIRQAVQGIVDQMGCFIVDITLSQDNDIEIVREKEEGEIDWDHCAAVDRKVHETFNQDEEDYSLTVSSAGLDRPFKVLRQYLKAIGSNVDVKFRGGRRLVARLTAATDEDITLAYTALEVPEGSRKKVKVEHEETFPLAQINSVTPYIDVKGL